MDRTELYRVSTQILENIINDEKNDNNILFDMDIWDWSQGVALYGIWKYYRLTGERRYLEYLTQWFDTKLNRPHRTQHQHDGAAAHTVLFVRGNRQGRVS